MALYQELDNETVSESERQYETFRTFVELLSCGCCFQAGAEREGFWPSGPGENSNITLSKAGD